MQKGEIKSFSRLLVTDTSRNLVRVFFLREKLKGLADGEWNGRRIHVIGAGAMGGDIAAWCAWHGFTVSLADMKPEPLAGAIKRAAELYGKIGRDNRRRVRDSLDRLIPDLKGEGVASADLIIEAVPENLGLKQKVFAGIEPKMKQGAILATNTSSIPLQQLREGLQHPDRLVGIHFFNPVSRMQLVEVVSHDKVADDVLADARAFLGRIDRLPAPVKSEPGFLVNRALTPYMLEAMVMLDEGIKKETIDKAAEDFGMPMGPIELADQVGLDICLHVAEMLKSSNPNLPDPPQWLKDKVDKGELGKKTGKGLYDWKDDHAVKPHDAGNAAAGCDRSPDPADAQRLHGVPPRRRRGRRGRRGRRHDLRHRLRAVPRRADALRQDPRRGRRSRHADAPRREIRPALPARPRLGQLEMNRTGAGPVQFDDAARLADAIVERVGKTIVLALPLGLGKANHIANALYARAVADRSIKLTIFTGLTLEPPKPKGDLERRFVGPFAQRVFAGYPALDYATAIHAGTVPGNVTVNEFFFEAGQWLGSPYAQQHYISANYTHALGLRARPRRQRRGATGRASPDRQRSIRSA